MTHVIVRRVYQWNASFLFDKSSAEHAHFARKTITHISCLAMETIFFITTKRRIAAKKIYVAVRNVIYVVFLFKTLTTRVKINNVFDKNDELWFCAALTFLRIKLFPYSETPKQRGFLSPKTVYVKFLCPCLLVPFLTSIVLWKVNNGTCEVAFRSNILCIGVS